MLARSRDAPWHPRFASRFKKAFQHLPKKGRGAPFGAPSDPLPPQKKDKSLLAVAASTIASSRTARDQNGGALALRRSTAVMRRRFDPPTRPGPRFLESPGANGRTLPGASAASTSHSDHAPEGSMPKAARTAVYRCIPGTAPAPSPEYPREGVLQRAGF